MRKKSYDIEPYLEDNLKICHASCCDIYEIGEWCSYLDEEDYTYSFDRNQQLTYSHDYYLALVDRDICGYFIGYDANILEDNAYGKKYDREFVILDTSSDCGNGSEYLQTKIFEYAKKVAIDKECNFVTLQRSEDTFGNIYRLCKDLGFVEIDGKFVLSTGFTQDYDNGFFPKFGEILTREELFELEEMGFVSKPYELVCSLRNGGVMTVDKETGRVNLEGDFVTYGSLNASNAKHRSILKFLATMAYSEVKHTFIINKPMLTRDLRTVTCDVIFGDTACICMGNNEEGVNISVKGIGAKYSDEVFCLAREDGINKILVFCTQYSFRESDISSVSTCYSPKQLPNLITKATLRIEPQLAEMSDLQKNNYDKYLSSLISFRMDMGTTYGGIRKLLVTFDNGLVNIKTNTSGNRGSDKGSPIIKKESFCYALSTVDFDSLSASNNDQEESWSLLLRLENEEISASGVGLSDSAKNLVALIQNCAPNYFKKE